MMLNKYSIMVWNGTNLNGIMADCLPSVDTSSSRTLQCLHISISLCWPACWVRCWIDVQSFCMFSGALPHLLLATYCVSKEQWPQCPTFSPRLPIMVMLGPETRSVYVNGPGGRSLSGMRLYGLPPRSGQCEKNVFLCTFRSKINQVVKVML